MQLDIDDELISCVDQMVTNKCTDKNTTHQTFNNVVLEQRLKQHILHPQSRV